MQTDSELVYDIIFPRVDHPLLNGYYLGIFNDDKSKFFAFTYVIIDKDIYDNINWYFSKLGSHSVNSNNTEGQKKYIDATHYQYKSAEECIEEGLYTSYAITFTGMFFENEWYVLPHLGYFGKDIDEENAKKILLFHGHPIENMWDGGMFVPYKHFPSKNGAIYRDVEKEAFSQMPWLLANNKIEKKQAVNNAFWKYMLEEVFKPLFGKLRIRYPQQYKKHYWFRAQDCIMFFPLHKKYTMIAIMVADIQNHYRLEYYIFLQSTQQIYRWKYPQENTGLAGSEYAEEVIKVMREISDWDNIDFLNSSRTMDDENFWNNYVFKKDNEKYIYLEEVEL